MGSTLPICYMYIRFLIDFWAVPHERNIKNWDQPNVPHVISNIIIIIRPLYNEVPQISVLWSFFDFERRGSESGFPFFIFIFLTRTVFQCSTLILKFIEFIRLGFQKLSLYSEWHHSCINKFTLVCSLLSLNTGNIMEETDSTRAKCWSSVAKDLFWNVVNGGERYITRRWAAICKEVHDHVTELRFTQCKVCILGNIDFIFYFLLLEIYIVVENQKGINCIDIIHHLYPSASQMKIDVEIQKWFTIPLIWSH